MSKMVVFGAGGRAGRAAVGEARGRGHDVTAVVRDPARHRRLAADGGRVVAGDATDTGSVASVAAGHDAAVAAIFDPVSLPGGDFYPSVSRALLGGLAEAGVGRLVLVGLASLLPTAHGVPLMDTPGYPDEARGFLLGHKAGLDVLLRTETLVDWVVISPAGDFDNDGPRTGRYRKALGDKESRISYPDLAIAVLDEIDRPAHHRVHLGVEHVG